MRYGYRKNYTSANRGFGVAIGRARVVALESSEAHVKTPAGQCVPSTVSVGGLLFLAENPSLSSGPAATLASSKTWGTSCALPSTIVAVYLLSPHSQTTLSSSPPHTHPFHKDTSHRQNGLTT